MLREPFFCHCACCNVNAPQNKSRHSKKNKLYLCFGSEEVNLIQNSLFWWFSKRSVSARFFCLKEEYWLWSWRGNVFMCLFYSLMYISGQQSWIYEISLNLPTGSIVHLMRSVCIFEPSDSGPFSLLVSLSVAWLWTFWQLFLSPVYWILVF